MNDTVSSVKRKHIVETEIYTQRYSDVYNEWQNYSCWKLRDEDGVSVDQARASHERLVTNEPTATGFVDGKIGEIPVRYRFVVTDFEIDIVTTTTIEEG